VLGSWTIKGENMDKYTKFILTIIAVGIIGINFHLFKDEMISTAHAIESHSHEAYDIYGLERKIENIVEDCKVREGAFNTYESGSFGNTWKIRC
tara:strand:+ start:144 stop:425 length:282 start_codon:yes stop_codon:yes gene_type:complete